MQPVKGDTIAAIATAPGSGGIGIVRVSGPGCQQIAHHITGDIPPPRQALYRAFNGENGSLIDRGIVIYYAAPHSYTGEDVLELQAHGGPALMQMLLDRCIALGARHAEPGEFTRRAYLNDKLDLAQAEAVADVISAATVEAARSAVRSLSGEFSNKIQSLLKRLIDLRLFIEACLDFPEEEIDFISQGNIKERLTEISSEVTSIFNEARQGNLLREGMQVVIIGQPNVGKSSLLNSLAGEDVAIVTPIAGTTRDTIKNTIQINGIPIHVIDTAGLRETSDEIERVGIARTWRALERADIAIILVDVGSGIGEQEKSILEALTPELPKIWVHNKIDLKGKSPRVEEKEEAIHVFLSAKTGEGIDLLQHQLLQAVGWQPSGGGNFMARTRHLAALTAVQNHLQSATERLSQPELVAEELRMAQEFLNSITGKFTPDNLLGEIFSRFCIGK
ncbi:MAG TPA: tRNA uridine-5-carboxymethylaminomethyl(34) synthesis GTPase MnmE [Methylophilaceae bacterium]|nr:tRNA uridine-5-carboxymethylaminomethyl(34) synthesis GTPase MnmE [Methylophilaceae bacterium]